MGDELQVEAAAAVNSDAVGVLKLDRMGKSEHKSRYNGKIRGYQSSEVKTRDKVPINV